MCYPKASLPHRIPARHHPLDKLIRRRVRNHKNIRSPGHRNVQEPLLQINIRRRPRIEKVGPHHEDDPVLQPLCRGHSLDLDRVFEDLHAGIVSLGKPCDRREGAEVFQKILENITVPERFSDVEDSYFLGLQGYLDLVEGDAPFEEDVCDIEDPLTFIGMVPASEQNRLWPPADGLARVNRHNRDGVLVVLDIFRREMCGKPEDLAGVPVIPVKVEGLVNGPADRFNPERLPAHGTDQPYPLVPVILLIKKHLFVPAVVCMTKKVFAKNCFTSF